MEKHLREQACIVFYDPVCGSGCDADLVPGIDRICKSVFLNHYPPLGGRKRKSIFIIKQKQEIKEQRMEFRKGILSSVF